MIAFFASLWASQRARKVVGYIGLGLAVIALLGALWAILSARENADDKSNQQIGATVEREKAATATIINVEKANAAAENVKHDSDAARAECLQNARNPADC